MADLPSIRPFLVGAFATLAVAVASAHAQCNTCVFEINKCVDLPYSAAACGSEVTISIAKSHSFSGSVTCLAAEIGYSFEVQHGTSLTLTAGECEVCRPQICVVGGKVIASVCPSFWPWGSPSTKTDYAPGITALTQKCETSPAIQCLCRGQGADCVCEEGSTETHQDELKRAKSVGSTAFGLKQVRGGDSTGREIAGLDSLCRLDIVLLKDAVGQLGIAPASAQVHLIGSDGSVEILRASTFSQTLEERLASLVQSGEYLDVNDDGAIDQGDIAVVLQEMGKSLGQEAFDYRADVNADGKVTELDLAAFLGDD